MKESSKPLFNESNKQTLLPDETLFQVDIARYIGKYVFTAQFVENKVVLDVGCGTGYGSSYLVTKTTSMVIGGDISKDNIDYARLHYQKSGLNFVLLDANGLPFPDDFFDVVISFEVIEHLDKYEDFLKECQRVLKKNGTFICSTPNKAVSSPGSDKPLFAEHVREFYIGEFRDALGTYFNNVALYGIHHTSKFHAQIARNFIYKAKPKLYYHVRPLMLRAINIITKLVLRSNQFAKLKDINEADFDSVAENNNNARVFLLQDSSISPANIIAVARK